MANRKSAIVSPSIDNLQSAIGVAARVATFAVLCAMAASCGLYYRAGIGLYYQEAKLPAAQVRLAIPYAGPSSTAKQRLNLFLPAAAATGPSAIPFVVFVHGGNWDAGDRDLKVGGADVYNNIGRYLASHGIGTAVISYRLLPDVTWREQIADVATAVRWVNVHAKDYGGTSSCVFVMGHSAGAQLAARVALDPDTRNGPAPSICGVIGVSGAAYDLADRATYDINDDLDWYEARFGGTPDWQDAASPIRFVRGATMKQVPPFLLLYAGGEGKALQRQSQLMHAALQRAGASSSLVVVPGESHSRIVLTLSRDDKTSGPAIVTFLRGKVELTIADCGVAIDGLRIADFRSASLQSAVVNPQSSIRSRQSVIANPSIDTPQSAIVNSAAEPRTPRARGEGPVSRGPRWTRSQTASHTPRGSR